MVHRPQMFGCRCCTKWASILTVLVTVRAKPPFRRSFMKTRTFIIGLGLAVALASSTVASTTDVRLANAAMNDDRAAVRSLLSQKVDVNSPQGDGMTALHWAAYKDD